MILYPQTDTSWIYFIRQGGQEVVKIGRSESPQRRLDELQTGNPHTLNLMGVIPESNWTEKTLHDRFDELHMRGEWYRLGPELYSDIALNRVGPLLDCPICGQQPRLVRVEESRSSYPSIHSTIIHCDTCNLFGLEEVAAGITVSSWNDRPGQEKPYIGPPPS